MYPWKLEDSLELELQAGVSPSIGELGTELHPPPEQCTLLIAEPPL